MSKEISDIIKEIQKNNQEIYKINKDVHSVEDNLSKEIKEIKQYLKSLDKKISMVLDQIQEFQIIMDAAEIIEDSMDEEDEEEDDIYNTEWNPYDDYVDGDGEENEDYWLKLDKSVGRWYTVSITGTITLLENTYEVGR